MARTKQTARKSVAQKVPRMQILAQKIAKKSALPMGKKYQGSLKKIQQESDIQDDQDLQLQPIKPNTDQFSLRFDDQQACEKKAIECEIIRCQRCQACLTIQSVVIQNKKYKEMKQSKNMSDAEKQKYLQDYEKVWICEFCLRHNNVPKDYVPPKQDNPCILVETGKKKQMQEQHNQNKVLIFCIDVSGSMDFKIQNKTRLQSVQQAILDQINRLKFQKQKIRIGIITFGSYVNLIGDGHKFKQTRLDTNLYKNFQALSQEVSKINNFCFPIQASYKSLKNVVGELCTYGATALGPALLSGVQLASKGGIGSKVILCTDGQANVGLGGSFNDDRFTFYEKMANYAKQKRVMVNILSLKGDKCNLKQLGKLSYATSGLVMKIDPKKLGTQFQKVLLQKVLGSQSKIKVILNKRFQFCNPKPGQVSYDLTIMNKDFGNFTDQTQLIFQFISILQQQAKKNQQIDLDLYKQNKLPMQIQLQYINRNGQKYLQIITDWRLVAGSIDQVYEDANFGLFAASVLQSASQKIRASDFRFAQSILNGYWSLTKQKFQKSEKKQILEKFHERVRKIEKVLISKKNKSGYNNKEFSDKIKGYKQKKSKRNRSRGRGSKKASIFQDNDYKMESDSEQQILYREQRARSRSRSRDKKRKQNKNR